MGEPDGLPIIPSLKGEDMESPGANWLARLVISATSGFN